MDTELFDLIEEERKRQNTSIELIASENYTSEEVLKCMGSILTNKYSEGYPGKRYYGGNSVIDKIEQLCIDRALQAFGLRTSSEANSSSLYHCNVQAYSGSGANLAIYFALLNPGDKIMGLGLSSGGHLTHGFFTPTRKVTASATYYSSYPYEVNEKGFLDYDAIEEQALSVLPKMIICGASAYSRDIDYERFREIVNKVKEKTGECYLHADISHIGGFVATSLLNSPFPYADTVMTTTHKSLRGPRGALIFCKSEYKTKIDNAIFPGMQGGPHQNVIAGIACQLREVMTPEFKEYMQQVRENAQTLANIFQIKGYKVVTDGTENHLFLLKTQYERTDAICPVNLSGAFAEKVLETINISVNKNTLPGDKSAFNPSGIRIGLPAMTTKGFKTYHMNKVAEFIDKAIKIGTQICKENVGIKTKEFESLCQNNFSLQELKEEVVEYLTNF